MAYIDDSIVFEPVVSLFDTIDADGLYDEAHLCDPTLEDPDDPIWIESISESFGGIDIVEGSFRYYSAICSPDTFNIGAVISASFECEVIASSFHHEISPSLINYAHARVYVTHTDGSEIINGNVGGRFILQPIRSAGNTIVLRGYDLLSSSFYNKRINVVPLISGKTLASALWSLDFYVGNDFPNSDYVLPTFLDTLIMTRREALSYIASIAGCYVRMIGYEVYLYAFPTPQANALEGGTFPKMGTAEDDADIADGGAYNPWDTGYVIDGGSFSGNTRITKITSAPYVEYYPTTITGVLVKMSDGTLITAGTDGYYLTITENPFITSVTQAQTIANTIFNMYGGLSFYAFQADCMANPMYYVGQYVEIEDRGNIRGSIITSLDFTLNGGLTLSNTVDGEMGSTPSVIADTPFSLSDIAKALNNIYTDGRLTLHDAIYYSDDFTFDVIRFYENPQKYGNGVSVGGRGFLVIGSGESPIELEKNISINSESTYICSDQGIYIEGGGNTGYANRKGIFINADGHLMPVVAGAYSNNTRNIGSSSYKFANVYATTFQGNATGLTTNAGSSRIPVYFSGGKPVAVTKVNIDEDIYCGSESSTKTLYSGVLNSHNNCYIAINGSSGQAGMFHTATTGKDSAFWITYINSAGTITRNTTSDRRIKDEVGELTETEASAVLSGVRPINFTYKEDDKRNIQSGIYAQDLRDVLKENGIGYRGYLLITENSEEGESYYDLDHDEDYVTYGIDYSKLVSVLIKGWQMHEKKIASLEERISKLEQLLEKE